MKAYTGVGSRDCPDYMFNLIAKIAFRLAKRGYVLRSGGAAGCDTAFEMGCLAAGGKSEIYIPWQGFNQSTSDLIFERFKNRFTAEIIAKLIHPAYGKLSRGAKMLHSRNVYQVFGTDLKSPSDFLLCYTTNGTAKGGTRTAIKLGELADIRTRNLYDASFAIHIMDRLHIPAIYYRKITGKRKANEEVVRIGDLNTTDLNQNKWFLVDDGGADPRSFNFCHPKNVVFHRNFR